MFFLTELNMVPIYFFSRIFLLTEVYRTMQRNNLNKNKRTRVLLKEIDSYKHGCGHLATQSSPVLVNLAFTCLIHSSDLIEIKREQRISKEWFLDDYRRKPVQNYYNWQFKAERKWNSQNLKQKHETGANRWWNHTVMALSSFFDSVLFMLWLVIA